MTRARRQPGIAVDTRQRPLQAFEETAAARPAPQGLDVWVSFGQDPVTASAATPVPA